MKKVKKFSIKKRGLQKEVNELKAQCDKLMLLAFHDELTGVYNRTWFNKEITCNSKIMLTMVDLNKLKTINDILGHSKGDQVLITIANKLKEYGDVVRFGGDEFIVISKTRDQFDKLNSLQTNKFSYGGVLPEEYDTLPQALKIADKRMYDNKKNRH